MSNVEIFDESDNNPFDVDQYIGKVVVAGIRDVNFFAFFAICAQIAIAIANFHNRSAIAIGF
jgi:hypothetical protein